MMLIWFVDAGYSVEFVVCVDLESIQLCCIIRASAKHAYELSIRGLLYVLLKVVNYGVCEYACIMQCLGRFPFMNCVCVCAVCPSVYTRCRVCVWCGCVWV